MDDETRLLTRPAPPYGYRPDPACDVCDGTGCVERSDGRSWTRYECHCVGLLLATDLPEPPPLTDEDVERIDEEARRAVAKARRWLRPYGADINPPPHVLHMRALDARLYALEHRAERLEAYLRDRCDPRLEGHSAGVFRDALIRALAHLDGSDPLRDGERGGRYQCP